MVAQTVARAASHSHLAADQLGFGASVWCARFTRAAASLLASPGVPYPVPGVPGEVILSANMADLSCAATRALAWSNIRCCCASGMTV